MLMREHSLVSDAATILKIYFYQILRSKGLLKFKLYIFDYKFIIIFNSTVKQTGLLNRDSNAYYVVTSLNKNFSKIVFYSLILV